MSPSANVRREATFFLTLDLECDFGTALEVNSYEAARRLDALLGLLEPRDVPLTVFLQTEVLDEVPEVVETLVSASVPVEVHAHSETHPRRENADVRWEVETSVERVRKTFETDPLGYRFPDGTIADGDYRILSGAGVDFDASVFPSLFPGRFNNLRSPRTPFVHDSGLVEIPFSIYSQYLPVPVSLSYLKLLGRPFESAVTWNPPETIVFDMHMHDLVTPETNELSATYRFVYGCNRDQGPDYLRRLLDSLAGRGYEFELLSTLYHDVATMSDHSGVGRE
ncbi:polysaccharide deacetylase family protein [Natrinema salsiterrestre]|uniref:Polysaccharide deacetylase family protein n=1 Tax=Natrinema salsiterrestre TaxID=2950540 RepID=A0A9Q4L4L1_9EURY|nr:polysaccharide deacetylase family protein [Natrinema salsiterrestre]MDF9745835.1 polysaccharide deacetylase family protein [Natrinema salsiterrestre]